jgi:hypothetical protein
MLIRATLIYCLAVSTLLFAAVALWQRIELGASKDVLATLAERADRLQRDLDRTNADAASAKRLAEAAEDSLMRATAREAEKPDLAQVAGQLSAMTQDRDAARAEAAAALREAEAGRQRVARMKDELTTLRAELAEARRAGEDAIAARMTVERDLLAVRSALGKDAPPSLATGAVPAAKPPKAQTAAPAPAAATARSEGEAGNAGDAGDVKSKAGEQRAAVQPQGGVLEPSGAPAKASSAAGTGTAGTAPAAKSKSAPAPVKKAASKRRAKPKASASNSSFFPF